MGVQGWVMSVVVVARALFLNPGWAWVMVLPLGCLCLVVLFLRRCRPRQARRRGTTSCGVSICPIRLDRDGHSATVDQRVSRCYLYVAFAEGKEKQEKRKDGKREEKKNYNTYLVVIVNPPILPALAIIIPPLPLTNSLVRHPIHPPSAPVDPSPPHVTILVDSGQLEAIPRRYRVMMLVCPRGPFVCEQAIGPPKPHPPPLVLINDKREPHPGVVGAARPANGLCELALAAAGSRRELGAAHPMLRPLESLLRRALAGAGPGRRRLELRDRNVQPRHEGGEPAHARAPPQDGPARLDDARVPREHDRAEAQHHPPCGDHPQGRQRQRHPEGRAQQQPDQQPRERRTGGGAGGGALGAQEVGQVQQGLQQNVAPRGELLERLDDLVQGLLVFRVCRLRARAVMMSTSRGQATCGNGRRGSLAHAHALGCRADAIRTGRGFPLPLDRSLLWRRTSSRTTILAPAATTQRAEAAPVHAPDEQQDKHHGAGEADGDISVQHDGPVHSEQQETLPGVSGGPCEQSGDFVEREQEWVAIGEGTGDLGRGCEEERALLVDEDGTQTLCGGHGILRGRGEGRGGEGGVGGWDRGRTGGQVGGGGRRGVVGGCGGGGGAVEGVASRATRSGHVG